MSTAVAYLARQEQHERFLDAMVARGVITRDQADAVTFKQVIPMLMPCEMVLDEETWEAIAGWQQRPDRTLDPGTPAYHEAKANEFTLYFGSDDQSVVDYRARADELRRNPLPPRVAGGARVGLDGREPEPDDRPDQVVIQTAADRRAAIERGRARTLTRG